MRTFIAPPERKPPKLPATLRRTRPRDYIEWAALRRWGRLPPWEDLPAGDLRREARERAMLTQAQLAERLGCSQQAVAQAERWDANPTVRFLRRWAAVTDSRLEITFAGGDGERSTAAGCG